MTTRYNITIFFIQGSTPKRLVAHTVATSMKRIFRAKKNVLEK